MLPTKVARGGGAKETIHNAPHALLERLHTDNNNNTTTINCKYLKSNNIIEILRLFINIYIGK